MTPKQLMLNAIRREPVDRIPAATYNFHALGGHSHEPAYQPMFDALAAAEHVGALCKCGYRRHGGGRGKMETEKQVEGDTTRTISRMETPKGTLRMIYRQPKGQPGYHVEPLIKTDEDIEKFLSAPVEPSTPDLSPAKEFYEKLGEDGLAYVSYGDPFYSIAHWFDFEDFAIRCLRQRPVIREMVESEFQRIQAELRLILEQAQGYDFLFYTAGPEVATPPLLGPDIFDDLVTPFEKELVRMIRESGHLACIHCHGRVGTVLEKFIEIGIDVLEPMEPPPQGDISLADAVKQVEGRMSLMGYIQDQDLYLAKPGEMRAKVQEICEVAKGRTGYIMTPTATPFMFPPPEHFVRNYVEFLEAAESLC